MNIADNCLYLESRLLNSLMLKGVWDAKYWFWC